MSEPIPNEYKCDACEWVYRPVENNGLDIQALPDGWVCPQCQADVDHFSLIVPTDSDLGADDGNSEEEDNSVPGNEISAETVIRADSMTMDVQSLRLRKSTGKLDTQPEFQRYDVWSPQKKSRLIESVLLGLPIPLIYLAEEDNGKLVVVDGQQRLISLFDFMENKYPLKGLKALPMFEKKKFSELAERYQDAINTFGLFTVTIKKESDKKVKFNLFERINEGATKLNDQELRNSLYRGAYNKELKKLSEMPEFWQLLNQKERHKRMVDVELVLRFMAFRNLTYLRHPDKKTKEFLNDEMETRIKEDNKAKREKAEKDFKKAVVCSFTVFGERSFRRFEAGQKDPQTGIVSAGKWESRFNRALYDVQMYGFSKRSRAVITRNANAIREGAIDLMSDPVFADLISHTISEQKRIERRFRMWDDMLEDVLGDDKQGARAFRFAVKKKLFDEDPTCRICQQPIQIVDDAHVDHILAFSKGGTTTADNAALAHRFCNQSKQAK